MRSTALALVVMVPFLPAAARAEAPEAETGRDWSAAFYVDGYAQRDTAAFLVPTVFADRGALHLEARYNYEDFDTASLFAGWSFAFGGEAASATVTPMLGGVVGNVNGLAPGLELDASWGRVAFWLEAEYVVDLEDSSASFLATWSELYVNAFPWLWAGGSVQRLKVVDSPTELDVGPMVGLGRPEGSPGWSLSFYAYGLTRADPLYLLTAALQL